MNKYLSISPEVQKALDEKRPVVALESTIISHGMPYPQNVETALKVEQTIRENGAVVGRVAHDGDVPPVLRGAAHHRRTADVDVFDGVLEGDALLGDGLPERIQVHAHEFDGLDAVLLQRFHMGRNVAAGQDAAVHLRVQRLHAAVADLREAGDFADADGLDAFAFQQFLRAAGGDDLPTEVHKALDELHEAGLVAYTN